MTMKVVSVTTTPFRIPLRHAFGFSTGTLTAAEHVLVEVRTDDGVVGVAEAIPRPMIYGETMASVLHAIDAYVAPKAIGLSLLERERFVHELRHFIANPAAKSGVELAMFDALGKSLGVPCAKLLGGYTDRVATTVNIGTGTPDEIAAEAVDLHGRYGVTAFKVKVGMDLQKDLQALRAVRKAFPDGVIYPDANHGYSVLDALRFVDETRELGLQCIEEPCPADDVLGRQRVCAQSAVPILSDESVPSAREVVTEVLGRRTNMISIKLARTAVVGSTRVRDFCAATGTPVVIGSQGDSTIGTRVSAAFAAAAPTTAQRPAELTYFLELAGDICTTPTEIVDGKIAVPDKPGFGIDIDADRLKAYRYEP
jgi:L-alanine-DL-glutamate epimerase-like enolase superfamily enzyme